jgi:L-fuculose-phosphate aldolase
VYSQPADDPGAVRQQLVSYSVRLLSDGLAVGRAGNLSVRLGDAVLITPSGVSYEELAPDGICEIGTDGIARAGNASSETPMHLAVYAATGAGAIVHTHSPEVIALSAVSDELPAIHYAITDLGGPVRVAPYRRFGSDDLAGEVVTALDGRRAAILANHGAVTYGPTLAKAYERAQLLEWLARVYRLAVCAGTPRVLGKAELDEVVKHARRIRYGSR